MVLHPTVELCIVHLMRNSLDYARWRDRELLEQVAAPDGEGRALLTQAAERFRLSARGYHRVLRVARTLADLGVAAGATIHTEYWVTQEGTTKGPLDAAFGDSGNVRQQG